MFNLLIDNNTSKSVYVEIEQLSLIQYSILFFIVALCVTDNVIILLAYNI